jgi:hypothetical protein
MDANLGRAKLQARNAYFPWVAFDAGSGSNQ